MNYVDKEREKLIRYEEAIKYGDVIKEIFKRHKFKCGCCYGHCKCKGEGCYPITVDMFFQKTFKRGAVDILNDMKWDLKEMEDLMMNEFKGYVLAKKYGFSKPKDTSSVIRMVDVRRYRIIKDLHDILKEKIDNFKKKEAEKKIKGKDFLDRLDHLNGVK